MASEPVTLAPSILFICSCNSRFQNNKHRVLPVIEDSGSLHSLVCLLLNSSVKLVLTDWHPLGRVLGLTALRGTQKS